ncbi:MAG: ribonuclease P protein component [Fimbriimonadales bacterium]|nr:ribonuclease P protein component [Fimbriimonadales bacterium]
MLPRTARLRKRHEFERAYQQGRRVRMATFTLYAYSRRDDQPTRIGIVAGRQFATHVQRNRARRRLRAACRALWSQLPTGYDLVLTARPVVLNAPFVEIQQELTDALRQLGLLQGEGGGSA